MNKQSILSAAQSLQDQCHGLAKAFGWWNYSGQITSKENHLHISKKPELIHSEISEAIECDSNGIIGDNLPCREIRELAEA